jgi:hypothetical protein
MESQHADAKEELLLELTSKNTTRSIKDFSPEGISLESNLEGEAKGVYNATFYPSQVRITFEYTEKDSSSLRAMRALKGRRMGRA